MLNPEANSSQTSIATFVEPTAPYNVKFRSELASRKEKLEDLRPAMDYFQQFLTNNEWIDDQFRVRCKKTWERYLSLVKEANGTKGGFLNVKIRDRKGHKTTDEFKIVVQDLVHDLRDKGTDQALRKAMHRHARKAQSSLHSISEDSVPTLNALDVRLRPKQAVEFICQASTVVLVSLRQPSVERRS